MSNFFNCRSCGKQFDLEIQTQKVCCPFCNVNIPSSSVVEAVLIEEPEAPPVAQVPISVNDVARGVPIGHSQVSPVNVNSHALAQNPGAKSINWLAIILVGASTLMACVFGVTLFVVYMINSNSDVNKPATEKRARISIQPERKSESAPEPILADIPQITFETNDTTSTPVDRDEKRAEKEILDLPLRATTQESVDDKRLVANFQDIRWNVNSLALSPDKQFLFAGKSDNSIIVFDINNQSRVATYENLDDLGQVQALAVTPDGRNLLAGGYSGRIGIWSIDQSGKLRSVGQYVGHSSEIKCIAISPDGKYALSGERKSRARLWEIATQKDVLSIGDFKRDVFAVSFSQDGKTAFAAGAQNLAEIDMEKKQVSEVHQKYNRGYVHAIGFSPDSSLMACSTGSAIDVYDTKKMERKFQLEAKSGVQWTFRFHPDGKHILSGSSRIHIWDFENETEVDAINVGKHFNVQTIALSEDGQLLVSPCRSGIKVYEIIEFGHSKIRE